MKERLSHLLEIFGGNYSILIKQCMKTEYTMLA